jgi:hypothetical protein
MIAEKEDLTKVVTALVPNAQKVGISVAANLYM